MGALGLSGFGLYLGRVLRWTSWDVLTRPDALLADADLPRKLRTGQAHRVRRCISCETCIDSMEQVFSVSCAASPTTGKERELAIVRAVARRTMSWPWFTSCCVCRGVLPTKKNCVEILGNKCNSG